ncbi:MAG TPA: CDP-alcohol phosphatidyltransferase family protein [Thermoanaerobaculia bacterium]|jgi:cardiolipin synthase|nr:CDP-alcohol phosphatidyltransferase family protein [Thermoanaerobaculia bacterium]
MIFTVPNLLTLLRMGLIPLFIITLVNGDPRKALLVFVVAGVTDALDGFIARFWRQQSLLGSYLDPLADKLLLMSAYVVLAIPGLSHGAPIPLWVTILVIARDVLLVAVALVLYLAVGIRRFPPTILSKINTVFQVVAVVLVLLAGTLPEAHFLDLASETALYLVAGLTLASGLDYVYRTSKMEKPPSAKSGGLSDTRI